LSWGDNSTPGLKIRIALKDKGAEKFGALLQAILHMWTSTAVFYSGELLRVSGALEGKLGHECRL
jgi:hypothetical protein